MPTSKRPPSAPSALSAGRAARSLLRPVMVVLVTLFAMVPFAAVGPGSASQLIVNSGGIAVYERVACSNATMSVRVGGGAVGANRTSAVVSNIPAACLGSTIQVALVSSSGSLLGSGSATCGSTPCTISTSTYNAPSVVGAQTLVATWNVPASWDSSCTWFILWFCS